MASKVEKNKEFFQVYWELKELNYTGLLIDGHGQIINENTEKAGLFSKYFCFLFGKKPDDVFVSYEDDETLSTPTVTEEDVKQLLLMLDLLKLASSDILRPRILKDLAEEPNGLLMFSFSGFLGSREIPKDWIKMNMVPVLTEGKWGGTNIY